MTRKVDVIDDMADFVRGSATTLHEAIAPVHPASAATDVRAIRQRLGLSQDAFACRFGLGISTLRDWEQGRRRPDQTARSYLQVIDREPAAVERALAHVTRRFAPV